MYMRLIYYLYHTIMSRLHRREGSWQTTAFEYHHKKRKDYKGLLLIVVVLFLFNQPASADFQSEEQKSIEVSAKLLQSTVKIDPGQASHGTGFFIAPNVILTNEHVIRKAASSEVILAKKDGSLCKGEIGYREEYLDLAIITTNCTGTPLTLALEALEGQTVIVAGSDGHSGR
jgi:S1-C subfamily serine protease